MNAAFFVALAMFAACFFFALYHFRKSAKKLKRRQDIADLYYKNYKHFQNNEDLWVIIPARASLSMIQTTQ